MSRPAALVIALVSLPASACEFHIMGFTGMGGISGIGHMMVDGLVDTDPAPLPPPTREEALAAVRAQLLARTPALLADAAPAPAPPDAASASSRQ